MTVEPSTLLGWEGCEGACSGDLSFRRGLLVMRIRGEKKQRVRCSGTKKESWSKGAPGGSAWEHGSQEAGWSIFAVSHNCPYLACL